MSQTERAIILLGGVRACARLLKVKPPSVMGWKKRGVIPARHVIRIECLTNGEMPRYKLRPDLYPVDEYEKSSN